MKALYLQESTSKVMDIQLEKAAIIKRLAQVNDESLIKAFKNLLDYALREDEEVVGYKPNGEPITSSELVRRAEASAADIEAGRTVSLKDFKKDIDQWKKQRATR